MGTLQAGVQEVVSEIVKRDGLIKPSILVEAARPKTSPAHNAFEWDNKKAGSEYRLMQARQWIRKVVVVYEDREERLVHVPNIVFDGAEHYEEDSSRGACYKEISIVAADKDEYKAAMDSTLRTLNAARRSYEELKQAAAYTKQKRLPNFKKADKGFGMVESALSVPG